MSRERYCTAIPTVKERITDKRILTTISEAFSVLIYCGRVDQSPVVVAILYNPRQTAAPKSSKTMDTVVEVGRPK
jgi:hypothetical protein